MITAFAAFWAKWLFGKIQTGYYKKSSHKTKGNYFPGDSFLRRVWIFPVASSVGGPPSELRT